jgi:integrase
MNNAFTGAFKAELSLLLSEARAIGLKYIEEERLMYVFDKLSLGYDCTNGLSKELVLAFIEKQPHWKRATQEYRIFMIRKIAVFLNNHGISAYVCDKGRLMRTDEHFKPHIFSYDEINNILKYADSEVQKRCNDRNHLFYPVIFRLLYCCGLRISEALNLKIKDIDFKEGLIQIKNSKNHKDRTIPIPDDLNHRFNEYFQAVHKIYHDDDFFFKSRRGGNYKKTTVYHRFRAILFKCGISHGGRDKGGPRLHDLRHTFCVHSLRQFLRNGVDYNAAFPVLSVYMGHSTLSATGKYLRLTADAFPEIAGKLESMYGNIIPELEVESHETY